MTITDLVLVLFIFSLLAYAIYDQFIMPVMALLCCLSPCFLVAESTALSSLA